MENVSFVAYDPENTRHYNSFFKLFTDYFDEICADKPEDNIPKHIMPKILKIIGEETQKHREWIYLCTYDGEAIGFVLAQIDTLDNPMCKREGWGFIREFYIAPSFRRKGYAKQMCEFIEKKLNEENAFDIYLTANATSGVPFWEAMSYAFSGKIDKNGNQVYEKHTSA